MLDVVGAVTGTAGLAIVLLGDLSATQRAHLVYFLAFLVAALALATIVARVVLGKRPARIVGRDEMVATGSRLLNYEICHSVVLFAGDASWAPDYRDDIARALANGKSVTVVYPASKREAGETNIEILRKAGAELIETPQDTGLRAMLVDHGNASEALLYMVKRNRDGATAAVGAKNDETLRYSAKIYDWREDDLLMSLVTKMFMLVSAEARVA